MPPDVASQISPDCTLPSDLTICHEILYTGTLTKPKPRRTDPCMCSPSADDACSDSSCMNYAMQQECGSDCPAGRGCGNRRIKQRKWTPLMVFPAGEKVSGEGRGKEGGREREMGSGGKGEPRRRSLLHIVFSFFQFLCFLSLILLPWFLLLTFFLFIFRVLFLSSSSSLPLPLFLFLSSSFSSLYLFRFLSLFFSLSFLSPSFLLFSASLFFSSLPFSLARASASRPLLM